MSDQYLRKCSLIVTNGSDGLDLSNMRVKFIVRQSNVETPNHAVIRVYNLSDETANAVQSEFQKVTLNAGYEAGAFGLIFTGTIKQVRRGRETPTDKYLDIVAADGDIPYNFSKINKSLAAGSTLSDKLQILAKAMNLPVGYVPDLPPGAFQRGEVMYGLSRDMMRDVANQSKCSWSIQNGELVLIPDESYRPGEAVVLNSKTGMIGLPMQTFGGIEIKSLLNPKLKIGGLVQIDSSSIQRALYSGQDLWRPGRLEDQKGRLPKVTQDGFYKILVSEFEGDTRGQEWYSQLTCIAIDKTAKTEQAVSPSGLDRGPIAGVTVTPTDQFTPRN